MVLALVYAVRWLRRYFHAHKVDVLTSYLIKQVMLWPEKSRHLAKYDIELGEHDIHFHPRNSIKAHALTDFLVEIPDTIKGVPTTISVDHLELEDGKELWKLYTNGAASKEGSGIGMILQSPKGEYITYALRFDFQVSNSKGEYEALLAGLRLAKEVGTKELAALNDSLLFKLICVVIHILFVIIGIPVTNLKSIIEIKHVIEKFNDSQKI